MTTPRDPQHADLRDPASFERWYRRLKPSAVAVASSVLRDRATAEDVVQEVFASLWSRPEAFRPERGSLGTFVHVMARSRSLDRLRSRAAADAALARAGSEARVHAASPESPDVAVLRRETARELLDALEQQPSAQRAAVLLHHVAGLTDREVADATGVPLGTAKSRVRLGVMRASTQLAA